jgi:low temperature requirement protein LtrA
MDTFRTIHGHFSYLVALVILIAFATAIIGLMNKRFGNSDKKISLFTLIFTHIQMLFGLLLFSPHIMNMGGYMKDSAVRLRYVEHPIMMVIVVVLVTIAHSKTKKATQPTIQKTRAILYGASVLFIALRVLPLWS